MTTGRINQISIDLLLYFCSVFLVIEICLRTHDSHWYVFLKE